MELPVSPKTASVIHEIIDPLGRNTDRREPVDEQREIAPDTEPNDFPATVVISNRSRPNRMASHHRWSGSRRETRVAQLALITLPYR
jgi:hypothetical protein